MASLGGNRGTQKITANGGFRSTLRNLETREKIKVSYFGRLRFLINADGTISVRQRGDALWWFTRRVRDLCHELS